MENGEYRIQQYNNVTVFVFFLGVKDTLMYKCISLLVSHLILCTAVL